MGPRYGVRYTKGKAGRENLVTVMCFLLQNYLHLLLSFRKQILAISCLPELCLIGRKGSVPSARWKRHLPAETVFEKPLPSHKHKNLLLLPV